MSLHKIYLIKHIENAVCTLNDTQSPLDSLLQISDQASRLPKAPLCGFGLDVFIRDLFLVTKRALLSFNQKPCALCIQNGYRNKSSLPNFIYQDSQYKKRRSEDRRPEGSYQTKILSDNTVGSTDISEFRRY